MSLRRKLKMFIPQFIFDWPNSYHATKRLAKRLCPVCGYRGYFGNFGRPPRLDARCMKCGSLERHRLFWLWFKGEKQKISQPILHFAPEAVLENKFRQLFESYITADIFAKADLRLNIENIEIESATIETVICNHVLEHVDDKKALSEIYRILSDDGVFICSVPIIEGWEKTYENENAKTAFDRELHFGQKDHIRYYGRDFRDRLKLAGFKRIVEYTAEGDIVLEYGLLRGEKIFICSKS